MTDLHVGDRLTGLRVRIDAWLDEFAAGNDMVAAVDRGTSDDTPLGEPRWYVRLIGDEKDFTTVWLTLGQRTLRYETYVMPAPEEHQAELMEILLRRNDQMVGVHFSIGQEDAVYLRGEIPDVAVTTDELDRVLGSVYTAVERNFRAMIRLGFASRFAEPDAH
ncbi:MAG: YbjN domain-containing protein [Ilumatobacteraceae bacterium]